MRRIAYGGTRMALAAGNGLGIVAVVRRWRRREVGNRLMADGTIVARREVALDAMSGHAPRETAPMRGRGRGSVALFAGLLVVAGGAGLPVPARLKTMDPAGPRGRVIGRFHHPVAGLAVQLVRVADGAKGWIETRLRSVQVHPGIRRIMRDALSVAKLGYRGPFELRVAYHAIVVRELSPTHARFGDPGMRRPRVAFHTELHVKLRPAASMIEVEVTLRAGHACADMDGVVELDLAREPGESRIHRIVRARMTDAAHCRGGCVFGNVVANRAGFVTRDDRFGAARDVVAIRTLQSLLDVNGVVHGKTVSTGLRWALAKHRTRGKNGTCKRDG